MSAPDEAARAEPRPHERGRGSPLPPVGLYVHVPVLRLALPVLRLRRRGRRRHARADEPDRGVRGGAARRSSRSGPMPSTLRSDRRAPRRRPPLETVYLGGGTPTLLPADVVAGLLELIARAVRRRRRRGDHDRGEPRAGRARRPGGAGPGRDQPDLVRRPEPGPRRAPAARAAPSRRRRRRTRSPRRRAAGIGSINLDLLYDVPDGSLDTWIDTLEAALDLEPDHLSLYALTLDDPDAEGLTGPDGDHLPTPARRTPLARPARSTSRTRTGPPRSTTTPSTASPTSAGAATRSATGRGRVTSAATTSPTGSAGRTRRSGRAPTPSTARRDAGTPPISAATSRRSRRPTDPDGQPRPAAGRRRDARRGRPRRPRPRSSGSARTAACRAPRPTSRRSPTCSAGPSPPSS